MSLYIVRWDDAEVVLVNAKNSEDLMDILDEIGNPHAARWRVYNGPLYLPFRVGTVPCECLEAHAPDEECQGFYPTLQLSDALGDTHSATLEALHKLAADPKNMRRGTIPTWAEDLTPAQRAFLDLGPLRVVK